MADIEEAFYTELNSIAALGSKIYPARAPQDTQTPYLVYELTSSERGQELESGHNGMVQSFYQFDFYHTSFNSLNSLKNSIINKVKSWNFKNIGTNGPYIQQCEIIDYMFEYDKKTELYVGSIDLQINYSE